MNPILYKLVASSSASVNCSNLDGGGSCSTGLPKVGAGSSQLHEALVIFFGVLGAISLLMVLIGALMFVTSGGNPQNAQKARETIIYAVVGLAVALSAEALVEFVLGKL